MTRRRAVPLGAGAMTAIVLAVVVALSQSGGDDDRRAVATTVTATTSVPTSVTTTTTTTTSPNVASTTSAAPTTAPATTTPAATGPSTTAATIDPTPTTSTPLTAAPTTSTTVDPDAEPAFPCVPGDLLVAYAASEQVPNGATIGDARCYGIWASGVLSAPGAGAAFAVFGPGDGGWRLFNVGSSFVCQPLEIPDPAYTAIGCPVWDR